MLRLQNVSKFYSRKGSVALGLRKINLTLGIGEFVAVVGESGSGKSTLLNVISGIDTYEDGEMYVNGEETSYYSIEDWENYRRKYVGFVFQNYNIIESYTVLQNVEAALILSGYDPENRRKRALDIIERVGLGAFRNTRAGKLSGGQMQRTVIARALAKDCPIIAADEPTGNLDSQTGRQIMELLHEISKDKLVIIVTHNYAEVEPFATRRITVHDGEVVEDRRLAGDIRAGDLPKLDGNANKASWKDTLLTAWRQVSSTPFKSLLMFMVLLMLTLGSALVYGSVLQMKDENEQGGGNPYFSNSAEQRVIVKKRDNSAFTAAELDGLSDKPSVLELVKSDIALDQRLNVSFPKAYEKKQLGVSPQVMPRSLFDEERLTAGRLPESEDEIAINTRSLLGGVEIKDILNHTFDYTYGTKVYPLKIVGVSEEKKLGEVVYLHNKYLDSIADAAMERYMRFTYSLGGFQDLPVEPMAYSGEVQLADGEVAVNPAFAYSYCAMEKMDTAACLQQIKGKPLRLTATGPYEENKAEVSIALVLNNQLNKEEPEVYAGPATYELLTQEEAVYQVSLMAANSPQAKELSGSLNEGAYKAFYPFGTLDTISYLIQVALIVFYTGFLILFISVFFFVTYFILRNIMRSKKSDYVILRSIGATQRFINRIVFLELGILGTFTYAVVLLLQGVSQGVEIPFVTRALARLFRLYTLQDYVYIFLMMLVMVLLLTRRFYKNIFSDSVMTTFKGEEGE